MNGELLWTLAGALVIFLTLLAALFVFTRLISPRTPPRVYPVIYHIGDTVDLRTKGLEGRTALTKDALTIAGPSPIVVPIGELRGAQLFRLHGTMRMIRVSHDRGTVYLAVVRVVLFGGYFAVVNFFRTGELADRLREAVEA
jgi:hypothetical protein